MNETVSMKSTIFGLKFIIWGPLWNEFGLFDAGSALHLRIRSCLGTGYLPTASNLPQRDTDG